ncbi:MAG: hypothetical protein LUI87_19595 [Lachnospiraceae bacterium]|nr:hypothetical protein [Lachnospiraceae bacterium]
MTKREERKLEKRMIKDECVCRVYLKPGHEAARVYDYVLRDHDHVQRWYRADLYGH